MDKIPDDIKQKINEMYPNPEGLSDILFDVRRTNAAKRSGAVFGYSLASEQLLEKDKEIERLKGELKYINAIVSDPASPTDKIQRLQKYLDTFDNLPKY